MVVQRRVPLDTLLTVGFGEAIVVAQDGRYRVWRVRAR